MWTDHGANAICPSWPSLLLDRPEVADSISILYPSGFYYYSVRNDNADGDHVDEFELENTRKTKNCAKIKQTDASVLTAAVSYFP